MHFIYIRWSLTLNGFMKVGLKSGHAIVEIPVILIGLKDKTEDTYLKY